jgi:UDP-glucose 4-epimerase
MGGELGTRVANLFEARADVEAVRGIDLDPPRGRITRAEFYRVDPDERRRLVDLVSEFEPQVVVHLGVYEPHARMVPGAAEAATERYAVAVLGAAARCASLEHLVARSGIEVYGRPRRGPTRPDENVAPQPTSPFGRSLLRVEGIAALAAQAADVPVTYMRFAPVVGAHFPSPLGRLLRLPAVPVSAVSDLPFSVLHQEDAAASLMAAVDVSLEGPFNIVAPGAITAFQAARLGGHVPLPVVGPGWLTAKALCELVGAPLPPHVQELLARGRTADASRAASELRFVPERSTRRTIEELHEWASVTYLQVAPQEAA